MGLALPSPEGCWSLGLWSAIDPHEYSGVRSYGRLWWTLCVHISLDWLTSELKIDGPFKLGVVIGMRSCIHHGDVTTRIDKKIMKIDSRAHLWGEAIA